MGIYPVLKFCLTKCTLSEPCKAQGKPVSQSTRYFGNSSRSSTNPYTLSAFQVCFFFPQAYRLYPRSAILLK